MKRFWPLGFLLILILFPFEGVGIYWGPLGDLLTTYFNQEVTHYLVHSLLFFSLGVLVLWVWPNLQGQFWIYLSLTGLMACGQEGFQMLFKRRGVNADEFIDVAIDLSALSVAYLVSRWWRSPDTGPLVDRPRR